MKQSPKAYAFGLFIMVGADIIRPKLCIMY